MRDYEYAAGVEIRVSDKKLPMPAISFKSPEEVANSFIEGELKPLTDVAQERFILLNLNTKNRLINYSVVSQGNLTSSIVHPREVLKAAILSNSASVIFIHNHPSGDPEPSMDDIEVTTRLNKAFNLLGIDILDHIIIGDGMYYSFKNHNMVL